MTDLAPIPVLDGQLEIPTTVLIPEDLDIARRQLTALDGLATASEWARAAIVAAWVVLQDGPGGIVNSDNGLTTTAFAELGIAGLKSPNSVRRYRLAWGDRPRPTLGEPVVLPSDPFPKSAGSDPLADDWYTPPWIFDQLGLRFDLDVCAPVETLYRGLQAAS